MYVLNITTALIKQSFWCIANQSLDGLHWIEFDPSESPEGRRHRFGHGGTPNWRTPIFVYPHLGYIYPNSSH